MSNGMVIFNDYSAFSVVNGGLILVHRARREHFNSQYVLPHRQCSHLSTVGAGSPMKWLKCFII